MLLLEIAALPSPWVGGLTGGGFEANWANIAVWSDEYTWRCEWCGHVDHAVVRQYSQDAKVDPQPPVHPANDCLWHRATMERFRVELRSRAAASPGHL